MPRPAGAPAPCSAPALFGRCVTAGAAGTGCASAESLRESPIPTATATRPAMVHTPTMEVINADALLRSPKCGYRRGHRRRHAPCACRAPLAQCAHAPAPVARRDLTTFFDSDLHTELHPSIPIECDKLMPTEYAAARPIVRRPSLSPAPRVAHSRVTRAAAPRYRTRRCSTASSGRAGRPRIGRRAHGRRGGHGMEGGGLSDPSDASSVEGVVPTFGADVPHRVRRSR